MAVNFERQKRLMTSIFHGRLDVGDIRTAKMLLTAICEQQDRLMCAASLSTSVNGLSAVRKALFMDYSDAALNGLTARFLLYFTASDLAALNGGQLLYDILSSFLTPPMLWEAYTVASAKKRLMPDGLKGFASLVAELLAIVPPSSDYVERLDVKGAAQTLIKGGLLHSSDSAETRQLAYRIEDSLSSRATFGNLVEGSAIQPGGRHDNDFRDYRKISIFPTKDELLSRGTPYMLPAEQVLLAPVVERTSRHLDNQFRLLREDMLAELREDLKKCTGVQQWRGRATRLCLLQFSGLNCGPDTRLRPATLAFRCYDSSLTRLPTDENARKQVFRGDKNLIKHGSFGCLRAHDEVIAFATIERDEDMLAQNPSVLLLRVLGDQAIRQTLMTVKSERPHELSFVMVDTPYFAYEPVLRRLQDMSSLPLADTILNLGGNNSTDSSPYRLDELAAIVKQLEGRDLKSVVGAEQSIILDHAQTQSLLAGLTQALSLIQGPPGTGKSFIGAILTKLLFDHVQDTTILILCYTNHALDQFLEDILDMGISQDRILRLGSKHTARTEPLTIREQKMGRARLPQVEWILSKAHAMEAAKTANVLSQEGNKFSRWKPTENQILEGLEFAEHDGRFYQTLSIPDEDGEMTMVGPNGKAVDSLYMLNRWKQGKDAGILKGMLDGNHADVWQMSVEQRLAHLQRWKQEVISERVNVLGTKIKEYDYQLGRWLKSLKTNVTALMQSKRIIGCTTTAAAKYADQIIMAKPGIVVVEEAGEVLESHILTALSQATKQMIMIGDHQQLRPKVANFALTVERGDGFDLNCSLFERLILAGYPHTVLQKQHRMRPEIAALVKRLVYPDLEDSINTHSRPDITGLQKNIVFIDHRHLESSYGHIGDRRDENSTVSHQNEFEALMILKIVKYLAQQGYGTDKQVVLTPYLGQFKMIMDKLKQDHDPVLGDLDAHDLIKAGLLPQASASAVKRPIRISTIDNFQSEESDIVIVSLTRSNERGDIGFMRARQRLNVLLSRARNGLIIIGNSQTFRKSKAGSSLWSPFLEQLAEAGQIFDGLPIKCSRHSARITILRNPDEFDEKCPNGGCTAICGVPLGCGQHNCSEKCHQIVDHSQIRCQERVEVECPNNHKTVKPCWQQAQPCKTCERDADLQRKRQQKQDEYLKRLMAVEDQITSHRAKVQDQATESARETTLKQRLEDLAMASRVTNLKALAQQTPQAEESPVANQQGAEPQPQQQRSRSHASQIWKEQKLEGATNRHIESIMDLIGLESVKIQVLTVKDKVDTALRQGVNFSHERFNVLLLGNPGTGKTTVARHYAQCLASMGVVSGGSFAETSASKIMVGGVPKYKKLIDETLNKGGGAIFIDEAYQLTGPSSPSGHQILDAIMDDAENLKGKVVFILAGYRKEMESLLSHNPGLTSRFPYEFSFDDYEDNELLEIFCQKLSQRFQNRMKLEGGSDGLFARIVARRVGYGRGRPGFGNARAVENVLARILSRQATRVSALRREKLKTDDFLLTQADLLGPQPSDTLSKSAAWTQLQSLTGLTVVKESINALLQTLRYNYDRELNEEPLLQLNLNRVFLGSPGTGKTTVAKLYGQVLADLGYLSNGEVLVKNPADFIGDVIGASERNTKGILGSTIGKVLVIDEAYGLHSSTSGGPSADIYKTAVIDTIVAEVQSVPGDDRCVLLLGYKEQMENMLQNANPGLARRFPLAEAFVFEDFTQEELEEIVKHKLKRQGYQITEDGMRCIMETLQRARNKLHFGNAGEVDIILNKAKQSHQQRLLLSSSLSTNTLEAVDVDPDFEHASSKQISAAKLFEDTVGQEQLVAQLAQIETFVSNLRARGLDPRMQVPYNFVFSGPPGTGKTTTARKMGQIYYNLGILATNEVLEKSASDLVGQYVKQTGPKTKKLLESAIGKVLFIDEAYRLQGSVYDQEAVDELVDQLTKPQFAQKLVVVLAGYEGEVERLMDSNPGLSSRFPERITFHNLTAESCIKLLISRLKQEPYLDISKLDSLLSSEAILAAFHTLSALPNWANGRDVETLALQVARTMLLETDPRAMEICRVLDHHVIAVLEKDIAARKDRVALLKSQDSLGGLDTICQMQQIAEFESPLQHQTMARAESRQISSTEEVDDHAIEALDTNEAATRDEGVSNEVWGTLQDDQSKALHAEERYRDIMTELKDHKIECNTSDSSEDTLQSSETDPTTTTRSALREQEQERVRYEILRREKEEIEVRVKQEQKMQLKLRRMGVCCAGYRWIKQASGYRCEGGSHFVSNEALEGPS